MKVYRLEHSTIPKTTPYAFHDNDTYIRLLKEDPELLIKLANLMGDVMRKHATNDRPGVSREFRDFRSGVHYAGCPSLEDLKEWFTGLYDRLIDSGFEVVVYEVDSGYVFKGKIQCIFPMSKAVKLK